MFTSSRRIFQLFKIFNIFCFRQLFVNLHHAILCEKRRIQLQDIVLEEFLRYIRVKIRFFSHQLETESCRRETFYRGLTTDFSMAVSIENRSNQIDWVEFREVCDEMVDFMKDRAMNMIAWHRSIRNDT